MYTFYLTFLINNQFLVSVAFDSNYKIMKKSMLKAAITAAENGFRNLYEEEPKSVILIHHILTTLG